MESVFFKMLCLPFFASPSWFQIIIIISSYDFRMRWSRFKRKERLFLLFFCCFFFFCLHILKGVEYLNWPEERRAGDLQIRGSNPDAAEVWGGGGGGGVGSYMASPVCGLTSRFLFLCL